MAVYTFSVKDKKKPEDRDLVERAQAHCEARGQHFSYFILALLREWDDNEQRSRKV